MNPIAYFGGAFDPIHQGHLAVALAAKAQFGLQQVVFVPTYSPWHKQQPVASFNNRCQAVQEAITHLPGFTVSPIEATLPEPSYTVQTLRASVPHFEEITQPEVNFILGADALGSLPEWKEAEVLKQKVRFLVAPRQTEQVVIPEGYSVQVIEMPLVPVSSTQIRGQAQ